MVVVDFEEVLVLTCDEPPEEVEALDEVDGGGTVGIGR